MKLNKPGAQTTALDRPENGTGKGENFKQDNNGFELHHSVPQDKNNGLNGFKPGRSQARSFIKVPDHPTYWRFGKEGMEQIPPHELPLGNPGCRWIRYHDVYGVPKWLLRVGKKLLMTTNDSHWTRQFAIFNELAEAVRESLVHRVPKYAQTIWAGLWSITLGYLGIRNTIESLDHHSLTRGLKKVTHDLIAAVGLPTLLVRLVSKIVNKALGAFGHEEGLFADIIRPIISFKSAKMALNFLDPKVEKFIKKISPYTFDKLKVWLDPVVKKALRAIAKVFFTPKQDPTINQDKFSTYPR